MGVMIKNRLFQSTLRQMCSSLFIAGFMLGSSGLAAQILTVPTREQVAGSPLAEAARLGNRQVVQTLLRQEVDVNGWGRDGSPALHWAVRVNDDVLAGMLIAAGADVNAGNRYQQAALHVAIQNRHPAMVRQLLAAGANVAMMDGSGELPLHLAARLGEAGIVDLLLEHGAQVDARDLHYGQSALMLAVREGHAALVPRLLAAGADVNAKSLAGEEHRWVFPTEVPVGTSQGVGINRSGLPDRGMRYPITGMKTPLLFATRQGNLQLTRQLVEAGADIEATDANGITPLINAILNHSVVNVNRTGRSDHLKIACF
jgi:ankyrin repeat protein